MSRPKRWCNISQDLNLDPEFEILCEKFGLGGVRFFFQTMAMLDKTDNHWCIPKDFNPKVLARICGTKPHIILGCYQLLLDMNWVSIGVDKDKNQFIYAPNYLKYRGNRAHEKETGKRGSWAPPSLSLPYKETNKEKGPGLEQKESLDAFEQFWKSYPARKGKKLGKLDAQEKFLALTKEDQPRAIQAAHNYANSQMVQDGIGIKDPQRFLQINKNGSEYWREWMTPEISQNGKGELKLCSSRIEVEGNLKTCKRPSTKTVGKSFICDECYELYQKKQGSLKQKAELSGN